jgi:hypothetical protein
MGVTIQFESHRVELAFVREMEHDPDVLEYYNDCHFEDILAEMKHIFA